jgi:hypothetical protein
MTRVLLVLVAVTALTACNGRAVVGGRVDAAVTPPDATFQSDAAAMDANSSLDAAIDATPRDAAGDSSASNDGAATPIDAASDGASDAALDASPARLCLTDSDCTFGSEWCHGGECVGCDNEGDDDPVALCGTVCARGRYRYTRNGCTPCECVVVNRCESDSNCAELDPENPTCYAGAVCPDWCPAGDPSCCFGGNRCGVSGCEGSSHPAGCLSTGCPHGAVCTTDTGACTPSTCFCDPAFGFVCTADCGGGVCISPP